MDEASVERKKSLSDETKLDSKNLTMLFQFMVVDSKNLRPFQSMDAIQFGRCWAASSSLQS